MRKLLVSIICCMIPMRRARHKVRRFFAQSFSNKQLNKFIKSKQGNVLLIEPNPYHGEIIPGFVKYWEDLGYKVDLILQPKLRNDSPFIRHKNKPNAFYMIPAIQKKALALQKIKKYDFVFMTTSVYWSDGVVDSYPKWLGFLPDAKYGVMMIEHNVIPWVKDYGHDKFVNQKRSFTLTGNHDIPMLNPHYFGDIEITPKSDKTIFSGVINYGDGEVIFTAVRKLLNRGITNFSVVITGRSPIKKIPRDLKSHIKMTGLMSFSKLWKFYETADFLLPTLIPGIPYYDRYKNSTVTGSFQTSLAFCKPMLMEKSFAEHYWLDDTNALTYDGVDNLAESMEYAIKLSGKKYQEIQNNIKKLADKIEHESLVNLKQTINFLKK